MVAGPLACNPAKSRHASREPLTAGASVAKGCGLVSDCQHTVGPADAAYPRRLRGVSGAPMCLHVRGVLQDRAHAVAIVGARAAEATAVEQARTIAGDLAAQGVAIVSGGALGIDAAAHRGALNASRDASRDEGVTVAVLGCGIDMVYPPQHQELFEEIQTRGGALVSEFPPGAAPRGWHFARRNQTIAGLVDAVVVVGAGKSSGALQTARAAHRLGRTVCAVPGSPGCAALIAAGAAVVETARDVWRALDGRPVRPDARLPDTGSCAARVLDLLHVEKARDHEEIAARAGLGAREVARALTGLELQGLAIALPGLNYVRSVLAQELLAR